MKQLKAIYYGLFAWGIASGCSGGLPDHPEEGRGDEPVPVFFCLRQEPVVSIACVDGLTKADPPATGETTELAINDLTVLQFDWDGTTGDGTDAECVTSRFILSPQPETGTDIENLYSIGLRSQSNADQYIIFIANAGAVFQNYEGGTLGAFREKTVALDQQTMNEKNIMMIAAVKASFTSGGNQGNPIAVDLQRLVARIRFTWKKNLKVTGANFTPSVLKIGNVPNVLRYADGFVDTAAGADYPEKKEANFKDYTSIVAGIDKGYTWYVPLNRHAKTGKGATSYEKDAINAPDAFCTYVELSGVYTTPNMPDQLVSYRFYPGGNTTNDYTIDRNCAYDIQAVIEGLNSFDKRVTKKTFEYTEPANCFVIAPEPGNELSFNPYLAPGASVAGTGVLYEDRLIDGRFSRVAGVKILWQTVEGLIRSVSLTQGMVDIATNMDGVAGNALVAIYDDEGTILWSWHIWVTPYEKVLYKNGTNGRLQNYAGQTWMDRNLGALSTIKGDEGARGVYYQWGRKDPFVTSVVAGGTAPAHRDMGTALNIDKSVENPTVFFTNQADNTWNGGGPLPALWQATGSKTLFDPCPAGWRLPGKTAWETFVWSTNFSWDSSTSSGAARDVEGETLPAWYPLSGRLDNSSMEYAASPAYLWSASFGNTMPYVFQFSSSGASTVETSGAWGAAVRCVKQ